MAGAIRAVRVFGLVGLLGLTGIFLPRPVTAQTVNPIDQIRPGEWYEVPNSRLRAVEKRPQEFADYDSSTGRSASYDSYQRNIGVRSVVEAWNGGAYDTGRDRLIVWGGGHNAYGGNEIYAFSLSTLRWERVTDPTPFPNRSPLQVNNDGTPVSRHAYGGLEYIAHAGRFFVLGGALDSAAGGCGASETFTFDFVAKRWSQMMPAGVVPRTACEDKAVYDLATRKVYYHGKGWFEYDVDTNTMTERPSFTNWNAISMVLDPKRRVVVEIGGGQSRWFDLTKPDRPLVGLTTTGATDLVQKGNPGLAYDPVSDRIIGWYGGADVYALNLDTKEWARIPPVSTNQVTPPAVTAVGGVYGRFRYVPSRNVFIVVNSVDENVFIYRVSDAGAAPPTTPPPDTTTPTVAVVAPAAGTSVAGTTTVSANASDNVGIVGVRFKLDGTDLGSEVTSSPFSVSWNTTGVANGSHTLTAIARDAAGNQASSAPVTVTVNNATAPVSDPGSDFEQRCGDPNVIRCVRFDGQTETAPYIAAGTSTTPNVDTAVKASGAGSLRFVIPGNSGANAAGAFRTNFLDDLSAQFAEGGEFYVQWRQRFSPEFLNTVYLPSSTGWKQIILGEGDRPGKTASSCTQLEVVAVNGYQWGLPQMYHSCGAKDGQYQGLYEQYGSSDFKMQNAMPSPYCLYSKLKVGDKSGCFPYRPDQWMTFQIHVKVGTWYKNDGNYHRDSWIELWVAEEGKPSQLVISRRDYDIANTGPDQDGDGKPDAKYGKVWLLPYMTGKDSTQSHPTAYTWYDDLIISRARITDPASSGATADTTAPSTPTGLTATAVSTTQINLAWTASTDNAGVAGYRVYRNGVVVATTPTTSYQDAGLTATTTYSYHVTAYDAAGNTSPQSAVVSAVTQSLPTFALTVSKSGTGSGTVTSSPGGISCGADCSEAYGSGTNVQLTAAAASGSTFAGWSGDADCADGVVKMDAARACLAAFDVQTAALTVTKSGTGSGTVTSSPGGISCGADCSEAYGSGTSVQLTAAAASGSTFAGWSGDADCADGVVTVVSATACTATFTTEVSKADVALYGPATGEWTVLATEDSVLHTGVLGSGEDIPVPADFDGDGLVDMAVWSPATAEWRIVRSSDGSVETRVWGILRDRPVPADFDGDGKADIAVWRPSDGSWWIVQSSDGAVATGIWGRSGDIPVAADYDGDRKSDVAVWRPSNGTWRIVRSGDGSAVTSTLGQAGDVPVPADYDGDGRADIAVYRAKNGTWHIVRSADAVRIRLTWGKSKDLPRAADYDGDGKADLAYYRPSTREWWVQPSSGAPSVRRLLGNGDEIPVLADFVR